MMDCAAYRRSMLTDPRDPAPALREHCESCPECALYTQRLLSFESRLDRALRVPMRKPVNRTSWLAMAASVLLACVVAGGLWLIVPDRSLAADVVTHVREEPQSWVRTGVPVPGGELQEVLRNSNMRLADSAGVVSYASSCGFRGHHVPHLVLQTESGPVTVMVLVHERVSKPTQFDEEGYRGVIVPVAGHGSLAVLTQSPAADLDVGRIAARVLQSIVWTG